MTDLGRRASAGEFGPAAIAEVITPAVVRRELQGTLDALIERSEAWRDVWPEQLPGPVGPEVQAVQVIAHEEAERRLTVLVDVCWQARFGSLRIGAGTTLRVTGTIRVHAHRPAVLRFRIDPLTPSDLRWQRAPAGSVLSLTAGFGEALMELTAFGESMLPMLTAALNAALDATVRHHDVCVPDVIRRALIGAGARAARPPVGERIDFAEFGSEVLRLAVDAATVRHVVEARLSADVPIQVQHPPLVHGSATPRLAEVVALPPRDSELRFAVILDIELDLRLGPVPGPLFTGVVSARTWLRAVPYVEPAGLLVTIDPFVEADVQLRPPADGRRTPLFRLADRVLPGLVLRALNERLPEPERVVAAELVGAGPTGSPASM